MSSFISHLVDAGWGGTLADKNAAGQQPIGSILTGQHHNKGIFNEPIVLVQLLEWLEGYRSWHMPSRQPRRKTPWPLYLDSE